MATVTKTIKKTDGDYSTIASWLAATDLNGGADIWQGEIGDGEAYNEELDFTSVDGTATSYVHLTAHPDFRHAGVAGTSHARITHGGPTTAIVIIDADYVRIDWLEINLGGTGSSDECIRLGADANNALIDYMVLWTTNATTADQDGIYIGAQSVANLRISNSVIYGFGRAGIHVQQFGTTARTVSLDVDHCSIWNNGAVNEDESGAIYLRSNHTGDVHTIGLYNTWGATTAGGNAPFTDGNDQNSPDTPEGTVVWNGSNNARDDTTDDIQGTDNLTAWEDATSGAVAVTKATGAWMTLNDVTHATADLGLLDSDLGNLLYGNGVNRQGSEPDARQDFSVAINGPRGTDHLDIGAFQFEPIRVIGAIQEGSAGNQDDVLLTFDVAPIENDIVVVIGNSGNTNTEGPLGPLTAGYTEQVHDITLGDNQPNIGVWTKVMGASPDTTVNCEGSTSGNDGVAYISVILRGVDTTTPMDAAPVITATATPDDPDLDPITVATAGALVMATYGASPDSSAITVWPTGYIHQSQIIQSETFYANTAVAIKVGVPTGVEDPGAATAGWGSGFAGALLAFRPSSGAPPGNNAVISASSAVTASGTAVEFLPQVLLPDADQSAGSWTTAPLWSKVDDDSPTGDGVEITSDAVGNGVPTTNADFGLSTASDPEASTDHVLRARWRSISTRDMDGFLELWEGVPGSGTLRATLTQLLITDTVEIESTYTLSAGEADAITDYGNLYARLYGEGASGGPDRNLVVDLLDFTVPAAASADKSGSGVIAVSDSTSATGSGEKSGDGAIAATSDIPAPSVTPGKSGDSAIAATSSTVATGTATEEASGTGTISVSSSTSTTGTAERSGVSVISVSSTVTATGTYPRTGAGAIAVSDAVTATGQGARSGVGTITVSDSTSASGTPTEAANGSGIITATSTITATGAGQKSGTGTIAETSAVTAAGHGERSNDGVVSVSSSVVVSASGQKSADATIGVGSTVTADGTAFEPHNGSGAIAVTSSTAATGAGEKSGDSVISVTSGTVSSGTGARSGDAVINEASAVTATGTGPNPDANGSGIISVTSTVTATGTYPRTGAGVISASSSVTADGHLEASGVSVISVSSSTAATGTLQQNGDAAIAATSSVTASGTPVGGEASGVGVISATSGVVASGTGARAGDAAIAVTSSVVAIGDMQQEGTGLISVSSSVTSTGAGQRSGDSAVAASSSTAATGTKGIVAQVVLAATSAVVALGAKTSLVAGAIISATSAITGSGFSVAPGDGTDPFEPTTATLGRGTTASKPDSTEASGQSRTTVSTQTQTTVTIRRN